MTAKEEYRQLCQKESIPIFLQDWWLDTILFSPKKWDVLLEKKDGVVVAVWVYHILKKYGMNFLLLPELTPYNGLYFLCQLTENEKNIIAQRMLKRMMQNRYTYIQCSLYSSIDIANVAKQLNFTVQQRVTYQIENITDIEQVFNKMHHSKRRHILKATKHLQVQTITIDEFVKLHSWQYTSKGQKDFYSTDLLYNVCKNAIDRGQGKLIAIGDGREVHSAIFSLWDNNLAYNLLYFIHPNYRSDGSSSMMIYEMIKWLNIHTSVKIFDFEGSQQANIAASYRLFGTKPIYYLYIEKWRFPLLKRLFYFFNRIA